jgi:TRAP-type C4-dicarboxylate transport system permease small subunit
MGAILWIAEKLSKLMSVIAGAALTFIMLLTVCDVFLRYFFDRPIIGTFEIVGLGGAVVIGFALPITSWVRGHIFVDFFVVKFNKVGQGIINITTRLVSIGLFYLIGHNLIKYGYDLYASGEVSLTRQIPFYPVAYGMAVCCFIQCLVLICDIFKIFGGQYE